MTEPADVRTFLVIPVPPGGTPAWAQWKQKAASLGPEAAPLLIEALHTGSENEQYVALLALRYVGFEAWGEGYGSETTYRWRKVGAEEWKYVRPLTPPEDIPPSGYAVGTKPPNA